MGSSGELDKFMQVSLSTPEVLLDARHSTSTMSAAHVDFIALRLAHPMPGRTPDGSLQHDHSLTSHQ